MNSTAPGSHPALSQLERVTLSRLGAEEPAGLWIASLPLPPDAVPSMSLQDRPTYVEPLGAWPGLGEAHPRRLLLVADGGDTAPERLALAPGAEPAPGELPTAEMELIARAPREFFIWEMHGLKLSWGEQSVLLALGLRVGDAVHWWENCRLVTVAETPSCRIVEMSGAIASQKVGLEYFVTYPGLTDPLLHRHNWVYGHLYARLHANGVCEIFARHINSKFVDDGQDLHDAVPLLGIRTPDGEADMAALSGAWDGSRHALSMGGVRFDVTEIARLATPEQPGHMDVEDGLLAWQPYQAMELYGGNAPRQITGDPYIVHPERRTIPRGMARSLRCSLSLNPARSPRVARYLAPAWWYGLCEEFSPAPLLPVSNVLDGQLEHYREWFRACTQQGGFEDGCVPRGARIGQEERPEPGWEGEVPGAMFLCAWRTGDALDYDLAMRAAYVFTDVYVDHADKLVRMHGQAPPAVALPMVRVHGTVLAYLETGDPYLLDTARAIIENAYWLHKNAWPRLSIGRDACFIRGAVLLYRYFDDAHFLRIARDSIRTVGDSQFVDGSFGDQGGGTGIHGNNSYVVKPWMGCMAVGGVIDYLELFPDDAAALAIVLKYGDWLLRERFASEPGGVRGWAYQHAYAGMRKHFRTATNEHIALPAGYPWCGDYLARILPFCSLRTGNPEYFDAWAEAYFSGHRRRRHGEQQRSGGDHGVAQAWQYLPWLQQRLWRAVPGPDGLQVDPVDFGPRTPRQGKVMTPDGEVAFEWNDDGTAVLRDGDADGNEVTVTSG
ncbi:MAG: hypothetical protein ACYDCO_05105 [Armatimonadota bacterium]